MNAPLWQRALEARAEDKRREHVARSKENGRKGGFMRRVHPRIEVGDVVGQVLVVADLGAGRNGRNDRSLEVECLKCGHRRPVYEYNLRNAPRCAVAGRQGHR